MMRRQTKHCTDLPPHARDEPTEQCGYVYYFNISHTQTTFPAAAEFALKYYKTYSTRDVAYAWHRTLPSAVNMLMKPTNSFTKKKLFMIVKIQLVSKN